MHVCALLCAYVYTCLWILAYILCSLDSKSKHCRHYTICLLTNNSWIRHHVFLRHLIQQAENWPEYLPCSSAPSDVWMQTQQLWLLLTVTTRTGCLIRFSEDLLLYLHIKVKGRSQIKQDITFLSEILLKFAATKSLYSIKARLDHLLNEFCFLVLVLMDSGGLSSVISLQYTLYALLHFDFFHSAWCLDPQ